MSAKKEWSPYGLEAIRIAHLRRRRLFAIMAAVCLAGIWASTLQFTTVTEQEIFANGRRASGISIDTGEDQPRRDGPVTVGLSPGRVTRADTAGQTETPSTSTPRVQAPTYNRAAPIPYAGYALIYGPFALLALAAWLLMRRRGKHDEVNYGIYKGAMPLEMISASQSTRIFTSRNARASLFGKRREDHLPRGTRLVERSEEGTE